MSDVSNDEIWGNTAIAAGKAVNMQNAIKPVIHSLVLMDLALFIPDLPKFKGSTSLGRALTNSVCFNRSNARGGITRAGALVNTREIAT